MKPPAPPNPRERAIQRALTFLDNWEDFGRAAQDSATARALLATWGNLCRLLDPAELPAEVAPLPGAVLESAPCWLAALGDNLDLSYWLAKSRSLAGAGDYALDSEAQRELELAALQMFEELDEDGLALCMARRLPGAAGSADSLTDWARQLATNEAFFAAHLEAFLPGAWRVADFLNACRPNLDTSDPELWETTLKHRLLEEVAEESEADSVTVRLNEKDRQSILMQARPNTVQKALAALLVFATWRGMQIWTYNRRALLPPTMGSAAPAADEVPRERTCLTWMKPDGTVEARMTVPTANGSAAASAPLRLFLVDSGNPAVNLGQRPVRMGNLERILDARARVDFTLPELDEAGDYLVLEVDGEPWPAEPAA
jgi:hypothetical protein